MASEIIDFYDVVRSCLKRWYWIALVVILAGAGSVLWTLSIPNKYRAEVVLTPVRDDPRDAAIKNLTSSLGGLAALAGLSGSTENSVDEIVAVLKSRSFGEAFIVEEKMLPDLFPSRWNAEKGTWYAQEGGGVPPDTWDAYKLFDLTIRTVRYDRLTGLVEVSFTWTDPVLATKWLSAYVRKLNEQQRDRAIAEANRNLDYLNDQLKSTSISELRDVIYRMIKSEIQTIMLTRGRQEYAFKTLSPALEPREKFAPRRAVMVIAITGLSGFLAVGFVLAVFWRRDRKKLVENAAKT